jgi:hypothetical protein
MIATTPGDYNCGMYALSSNYTAIPDGFVTEARKVLGDSLFKIEHCVKQLSEDDIWWRPADEMNAVGNLVLHLAGNVTQWIICGIGGEPDHRDRPTEFAMRGGMTGEQLLIRLRNVVARADDVIAATAADQLLVATRIQGFDTQPLTAIWHAASHFEGHAQEILYITRMRLGGRYEFIWKPTKEQGA